MRVIVRSGEKTQKWMAFPLSGPTGLTENTNPPSGRSQQAVGSAEWKIGKSKVSTTFRAARSVTWKPPRQTVR